MTSFNPACYLPSWASDHLPTALACPPPPSLLQSIYNTLTSPFGSTFVTLKTAMDALLSLPFLSFLLIPTMTSYSTSLNILFFYLTWSTLILSHSPLKVEIVASLAVKILFYIMPSSLFLTLDVLFPSLIEPYKSSGKLALPMRNFTRSKSPKHLKIIGWSLLNVLISITAQAMIEYTLTAILNRRSALKVTTTLPLPWAITKDLLRGLILRDILTYLIHRYALHSHHTNSNLSQLHTSWYHTHVPAPFPLSSSYDHPLIHLLHSFIPTYIPAMLWRFHLLTFIIYLSLISLEETFTHSGYSRLPTSFILGGIAKRNDAHCVTRGEGNFGTWGLMDWIMGTSLGGDVVEDVVDEVDEVDEKRVVRKGVGGKVRGGRGGKRASSRVKSSSGSGVERRRRRSTRRTDSDYED